MLDFVKALVAMRLVAYFATFIVVFGLLGVWSLSRGSTATGIAVLAADVAATGALGLLAARRATGGTG